MSVRTKCRRTWREHGGLKRLSKAVLTLGFGIDTITINFTYEMSMSHQTQIHPCLGGIPREYL